MFAARAFLCAVVSAAIFDKQVFCRVIFYFCQLAPAVIFARTTSSRSKFSSFLSTANAFTFLHSSAELKICLNTIWVWSAAISSSVATTWKIG